jgi:hypothetical protein
VENDAVENVLGGGSLFEEGRFSVRVEDHRTPFFNEE